MMTPVDQIAREALENLSLPPSPTVVRLDTETYTDSTGDPALRVWIILDESVDVEQVPAEQMFELKSVIREGIRKLGVELFVYIVIAKQSELDDANDEE